MKTLSVDVDLLKTQIIELALVNNSEEWIGLENMIGEIITYLEDKPNCVVLQNGLYEVLELEDGEIHDPKQS